MPAPKKVFQPQGKMPRVPQVLRPIVTYLMDQIAANRPIEGIGTQIDRTQNGVQIHSLGGSSKAGGSAAALLPFQLVDATDAGGLKIKVADGQVNDVYPDGMGSGNYILNVGDGSLIYAGITFAVATLEINSRFLGVSGSADYPISRVESSTGYLYWLLGFTYLDAEGAFQIQNTRVGNIDFAFTFGSNNGAPGLLPVDSGPGWLSMDSFFTT